MSDWSKGHDEMIDSFRRTLAPDAVWENVGISITRSRDEAVKMLSAQEGGSGVFAVDVEMVHIAEVGNVVLTERVDTMRSADGTTILRVPIAGILEFNEADQIAAWREYFDPRPMTERPSTKS